jgi:hypothetical protein
MKKISSAYKNYLIMGICAAALLILAYCVSAADLMYYIEAEVSANDAAFLSNLSARDGYPSHFPSTVTGYRIEVLSSEDTVLLKENLAFSFNINEEYDNTNLSEGVIGESASYSDPVEEEDVDVDYDVSMEEVDNSNLVEDININASTEVDYNLSGEGIVDIQTGAVEVNDSSASNIIVNQQLFVRVPYFPTAKKILVYHQNKVILLIDLEKDFCNRNGKCDLGENGYNCQQDCMGNTTTTLETASLIKDRTGNNFNYLYIVLILLAIVLALVYLAGRKRKK